MEFGDFGHHTSHTFNEELQGVRNSVLNMGGLVEAQLDRAIQALTDADSALGLAVAHDDYRVDQMELSIDEACRTILATRGPAAGDLRLIIAIIKAITDLERIGDEAEHVGEFAARLASAQRTVETSQELQNLCRQVKHMVHTVLDAFARFDVEAAFKVLKADRAVDEQYEAICREGIAVMTEEPHSIERVMDTMWTARALERIGDHAKNIGEYVIFMVHGKDVRHSGLDALEAEAHRVSEEHKGPQPK